MNQPVLRARGFTLLELMVVVAIIALASAAVTLALPDTASTRLEREATRLIAILETARVQARSLGTPVRWIPGRPRQTASDSPDQPAPDFHFTGLPEGHGLPERWSDTELAGKIGVVLPAGQNGLVLGPEPVIPPQTLTLQLDDKRLRLSTDGLSAFAVIADAPAPQ
ncbi:prepilin-type N-terminal cleavage/methylation domain-containing protein [Sphaerotilus sp.]|uniref:pilus assembly FimT family protein n=1 Tax=Sphaerotilus sp. TaxID=2093942 RepID=UPI00286E6203|nr:prepilin-type N-terminal cleavage/methylation domain-containing protein [Sphaerotilus sp.]